MSSSDMCIKSGKNQMRAWSVLVFPLECVTIIKTIVIERRKEELDQIAEEINKIGDHPQVPGTIKIRN